MKSKIEPNYEAPYAAWQAQPTPANAAALLGHLEPVLRAGLRRYAGGDDPLLYAKARRLAFDSLAGYDPQRGGLEPHLYSQLQGLRRISQRQNRVLGVPERVAIDRGHVERMSTELEHELGRHPSDQELMDRAGFSAKRLARIRQYVPPIAEGTLESANQQVFGEVSPVGGASRADLWKQIVYDDLDPHHQSVMEHTLGMNGRKPLDNASLAKKLGRSPGAISQAKQRIQTKLDEGSDLFKF